MPPKYRYGTRRTYRTRKPTRRVRRRLNPRRTYRGKPRYNTQYMTVKRRIQLTGFQSATEDNYYNEDPYIVTNSGTLSDIVYDAFAYTFQPYGVGGTTGALGPGAIPNFLEYAQIYEEYRIKYIALQLSYLNGTSMDALEAQEADPFRPDTQRLQVLAWVDTNSAEVPTKSVIGWNNAFESGRSKVMLFPNNKSNQKNFIFRPGVLVDVFQSGSTNQYARTIKAPWLKTANNTTHYGFKIMLRADPTFLLYKHSLRIYVTYGLQFRYAKGEANN